MRMTYDEFMNGLNEYYILYDKGLKKQANAYIKRYIADFKKNICEEDKNNNLFNLCQEVCNRNYWPDRHWLMKRGNGHFPFELSNCVREYLYIKCKENRMPHLRWFYQLYKNDTIVCEDAFKMLDAAYNHDECDEKVIELYIDSLLDWLGWGAHHFPDGCIISKESYIDTINECNKVLNEREVSNKQKNEIDYFKKLYKCWERYNEENRNGDFNNYCKEYGIT